VYDSVNKVFYANAGSGSFVAGPVRNAGKGLIFDSKDLSAREIIEV
jgi:hypothetical protein